MRVGMCAGATLSYRCPVHIFTGSSLANEYMRITSAGLVGIGTSSPGALLDLASTAPVIQFTDTTGSGERNWRIGISDITEGDFNIKQETGDDTNTYASRLYISAAGNVGIGTTSPQAALSISKNGEDGVEFIPQQTTITNQVLHYNRSTSAYSIVDTRAAQHLFRIGGSEAARIDSSGRLLVGTSSALATYASQVGQVQFAQTNTVPITSVYRFTNDTGGPNFYFNKSRSSSLGANTIVQNADALGALYFAGANGSSYSIGASISAAVDGTPGANDMPGRIVLSTTADGAASPTERLRIDSSGRVGIGTASPAALLTTQAAASVAWNTSALFTGGANGDNAGSVVYIRPVGNSYGGAIYGGRWSSTNRGIRVVGINQGGQERSYVHVNGEGDTVEFATATAERARIDSSGRLGIGTSSPTVKLTAIAGAINSDVAVFSGLSTSRGLKVGTFTNTNSDCGVSIDAQDPTYGALFFKTKGTGALFIDPSQRVGIGTTSPGQALDVVGSINLTGNHIFSTTTSAFIAANAANSVLRFGTGSGGIERARIDASGRLLVGTSTSLGENAHLQVVSTIAQVFDGYNFRNDAIGSELRLGKARGGSSSSPTILSSGDSIGRVIFRGHAGATSGFLQAAYIDATVDGTPGTNDMPGRLVFSTTADGASSPTERLRIDKDGPTTHHLITDLKKIS
jgi:hypothetical protein